MNEKRSLAEAFYNKKKVAETSIKSAKKWMICNDKKLLTIEKNSV